MAWEDNNVKPVPLKVLENLSGQTPEKKPVESTETSSSTMTRTTSHIMDTTDQCVMKSLIITGVATPAITRPQREKALCKPMKASKDKPMER